MIFWYLSTASEAINTHWKKWQRGKSTIFEEKKDMIVFISSLLITLALIFYSLGIWAERWARYLKGWHVVSFWLGFAFDISGTYAMHFISEGDFNFFEPHTFTGQIALWLMFIHAFWASRVIKKNNEVLRKSFHRYSLFVWFIWLIPYIGGMIMGMNN